MTGRGLGVASWARGATQPLMTPVEKSGELNAVGPRPGTGDFDELADVSRLSWAWGSRGRAPSAILRVFLGAFCAKQYHVGIHGVGFGLQRKKFWRLPHTLPRYRKRQVKTFP